MWRWNSTTPYLFGGLVIIMGLIALALMILACSYRKIRSSSPDSAVGKFPDDIRTTVDVDLTPKIVVLMAGDDMPTFIAVPTGLISTSSNYVGVCKCGSLVV
ncbi:hypothetical protein RND81_10G114600 [Saponaria officinalis]|uniref:Uncharacterized protein n=1 Tax=Saponaria officinalis TaxID=3572 RepID=A0AAW1I3C2_SAPOF